MTLLAAEERLTERLGAEGKRLKERWVLLAEGGPYVDFSWGGLRISIFQNSK